MYPYSPPINMGLKLTLRSTITPTDKLTTYDSIFGTFGTGERETTVQTSRNSFVFSTYNSFYNTFYNTVYSSFYYTPGDHQTFYDTVVATFTNVITQIGLDGNGEPVFAYTAFTYNTLRNTSSLTGGDPVVTSVSTFNATFAQTYTFTGITTAHTIFFNTTYLTSFSGSFNTSVTTSRTTTGSTTVSTWSYTTWI